MDSRLLRSRHRAARSLWFPLPVYAPGWNTEIHLPRNPRPSPLIVILRFYSFFNAHLIGMTGKLTEDEIRNQNDKYK